MKSEDKGVACTVGPCRLADILCGLFINSLRSKNRHCSAYCLKLGSVSREPGFLIN